MVKKLKQPIADAVVLGRYLGTYRGWDEVEDQIFVLFDLQPIESLSKLSGDVTFDLHNGWIIKYDDSGKEIYKRDISLITNLPRKS